MNALTYPAWFTGPKGDSKIFNSAAEVPAGYTSGAEKQTADGKPAKAAPAAPAAPKPATKTKPKRGRPAKPAPLDL